jgi:hypothetical protein
MDLYSTAIWREETGEEEVPGDLPRWPERFVGRKLEARSAARVRPLAKNTMTGQANWRSDHLPIQTSSHARAAHFRYGPSMPTRTCPCRIAVAEWHRAHDHASQKKTWTMAKIIFLLPKEKKINFLLTQLEKSFPKNT